VRVQSQSELDMARAYNSMADPPCRFVVKESVLQERTRSLKASRILASARMFRKMFAAPGFVHTLMAFGIAEATINGFAAFMFMIMEPCSAAQARMACMTFSASRSLFPLLLCSSFSFAAAGAIVRCSSSAAWSVCLSSCAWSALPSSDSSSIAPRRSNCGSS
jgi:hypothetical protein